MAVADAITTLRIHRNLVTGGQDSKQLDGCLVLRTSRWLGKFERQPVDPPMVRATGPATVGGGDSADRKLVMEFSSDVLRRSRQRAERERSHGGLTSGCSLWFAHAGQEAHLHYRGSP